MQLMPRYDGSPVLGFQGPIGDPSVALLRQRRRLGHLLEGFGDEEWAAPSRCADWSVRDVIAHLVGVDQFWTLSITQALAGSPTRFLVGFDPVATPASLVDGMRAQSASEVRDGFLAGIEQLADLVNGLDEAQWSMLGEAPPGHVPLHALARHALWDAWIHERDIALPLGIAPDEEPDEVRACLEYAAALSPAFLAMHGSTRTGTLVVEGTDTDLRLVVEVGAVVAVRDCDAPGDVVLAGRSVDLVEGLSLRAPLPHDVDSEHRWMLTGLATVFDVA